MRESKQTVKQGYRVIVLSAVALLLASCGGSSHDDDHGDVFINTSGRLVVAEKDAKTVRVHDLDSNTVEASYEMQNPPSAIYASPQERYALVVQRNQDVVQFLDGGIWQEDHVDHLHDYKQGSKALTWSLSGSRPTHYDMLQGRQSSIFMDGNSTANPPQNAGFRILTDTSIAQGKVEASHDFSFAIHGFAEPVGNNIFSVSRASDAPDTLPTHVHWFKRNGSTIESVRLLSTRCNGMHGSQTVGKHTVIGCREGMMVVDHTDPNNPRDSMAATPIRVGTIAGHHGLEGQFIGIGNEGTAPSPVTTRFYALDARTGAVTTMTPQGWDTGRVRRAFAFDRSGRRFFVLDDQGNLSVNEWNGSSWQPKARLAGLIPTMPTASPWPALVENGAVDEIYLTDPVGKQLIVLNSSTGAVITRRDLGYSPSSAAWVGIRR